MSVAPETEESRVRARSPGVSIRVVSDDERGLAEVLATWTLLEPTLMTASPPRVGTDWERVEALSCSAWTDSAGVLEFQDPLPGSFEPGSALWFTRPGFAPELVVLAPGEAPPAQVTLRAKSAMLVAVEYAGGGRVEGAEVFSYAAEASSEQVSPLAVYRRVHVTGRDGTVEVPALPVPMELGARKGAACTIPWRGTESSVTLVLGPTFSAGGLASVQDQDLPAGAAVEVGVRTTGGLARTLRRVEPDARTGEWLAVGLPLTEVEEVTFVLSAPGYAPASDARFRPHGGAHLVVDLTAVPGARVPVVVLDDGGRPVRDAVVTIHSSEADRVQNWSSPVDDEGTAMFTAVAPGRLDVEARAPGRVPTRAGPFAIAGGMDYGAIVVELPLAGRVRVRCLRAGEPISDFDVRFWQGPPDPSRRESVSGSADGTLELDDVPLGSVRFTASVEGLPRTDVRTVEVLPGVVTDVALEIPTSLEGTGRVVDGFTGRGVPDAEVRVVHCIDTLLFEAITEPAMTGPDGSFRVEGLGAEVTGLMIRAPGFAQELIAASRAETRAGIVDLGRIPLVRASSLEVRLHGLETLSGWTFSATGPDRVAAVPIPGSGVLRIDELPPGPWSLLLNHRERGNLLKEVSLAPPGPWTVTFEPDAARALLVEVVDARGDRQAEFSVRAHCAADTGPFIVEKTVDESGIFRLQGVAGEEAVVVVNEFRSSTRVPLLTRRVRLDGSAEQRVRMDVGEVSQSLRVLDASGVPLEGCRVFLYGRDDPLGWGLVLITDSRGECAFGVDAPQRLSLVLSHDRIGTRVGVPCDVADARQALGDFTLSVGRREVRVHERGTSQPHVRFELKDHATPYELPPAVTDEDGLLQLAHIGGPVEIELVHPGYWTMTTVLDGASGSSASVEVRRLGGLRFEARDSGGAAVPGASIDLVSEECGTHVATWVAEGRVDVLAGELRTDRLGELALEGLPNGDYSWSIAAPGGGLAAGRVSVPPHETARVAVLMDGR